MEDFLTKHNFSKKDIKTIAKTCREIDFKKTDFENLERIIEYFLKLHFSQTAIARRIKAEPQLATTDVESIKKRVKELKDLKYDSKDIAKMLQINSKILTNPSDYVKSTLDFILSKKIKPNIALSMTVHYPYLFDCPNSEIDKKLAEIEKIGFSKEQALSIFEHHPAIVKKEPQFLLDHIGDLMDLDFTLEEAHHLISFSKVYLRGPRDVILAKIKLFLSLGLKNRILTDPYALVANIDSTLAKVEFLKGQGYTSPIHLDRYLFMSGTYFKNRFLVSPKEILVIYKARRELEIARQKKKEKE